jgi:hypothetical protein
MNAAAMNRSPEMGAAAGPRLELRESPRATPVFAL